MKNKTFIIAMNLNFDYENSRYETKEELEQQIFDFLNENSERLPVIEEECEVTGNGTRQHVSFGDFESSGEIIHYDYELRCKPSDYKIYHSEFIFIDEKTGEPFNMKLFCYLGNTDCN